MRRQLYELIQANGLEVLIQGDPPAAVEGVALAAPSEMQHPTVSYELIDLSVSRNRVSECLGP